MREQIQKSLIKKVGNYYRYYYQGEAFKDSFTPESQTQIFEVVQI